ncbi:unnamed protein product [marine sediment metagenome]|uniref:Uncharacterized protein n=1 Tax=marine sediment metagenome TaxID=412755 RepID=X1ARN5_9ZZZZ
MIDSAIIKNIIEKDFQKVINKVVFENENHLKDKLVKFFSISSTIIKCLPIMYFSKKEMFVSTVFIFDYWLDE